MRKVIEYSEFEILKYFPVQFEFEEVHLMLLMQLFCINQQVINKSLVRGHSQFCDCSENYLMVSILYMKDVLKSSNKQLQEFINQHFTQSTSIAFLNCPKCMTWTIADYF